MAALGSDSDEDLVSYGTGLEPLEEGVCLWKTGQGPRVRGETHSPVPGLGRPRAETPQHGRWKQPEKGVRRAFFRALAFRRDEGRLWGLGSGKMTKPACGRALFGMVRQWLYWESTFELGLEAGRTSRRKIWKEAHFGQREQRVRRL